ncbi:hypothetical protein PVK06_035216 [Gossypium arboreum]|uniref:Putative plant transposon protein domain-containing protein n=1 Tax=Gossypium arboreum TaxID=29729 RepID=A0ABR0NG92_GOSAR|nr:hypothetical protein PVK06_035216 [Gossypium arboreum]
MARTRGSAKKATKPVEEHSSFATVVRESESSMPTKKKELGILLSQQQNLGKQVSRTISKLKWATFCTHTGTYSPLLEHEFYANFYDFELEFIFVREGLILWDATKINELYNTKTSSHQKNYTMHHRFLTLQSKIWFHFVKCKLLLSTHSTAINLDRMIGSLVEGEVIANKEAPAIEEEVAMEEEDICIEVVNKKAKEENTKTEAAEKESVEDIVNASELMDATKDNLELDWQKLQR